MGRWGIALTAIAAVTAIATSGAGPAAGATGSAPAPVAARLTDQAPGGAATAGRRVIALTFDDGPGPYTPQVLAVLERYHVPATFFEIGMEVANFPAYARMVTSAGYPIENHTWSHPDLATLSAPAVSAQIDQAQAEIRSVTGQNPTCLRPPYNSWSTGVLQEIAAHGLTTMSYSVDPRDWSRPGTSAIVDRVVGAAFPGAVVDLHDGGGDRQETVDALPAIITQLSAEGYSFVSICGAVSAATGPQKSTVVSYGPAPAPGPAIVSDSPLTGMAATPDGKGYWLAAADGGIFTYGDAGFYGSAGGTPLAKPIVGIAATPDGKGYWLAAADGGIFTYGDAGFHGSTSGTDLAAPIVAIAPDATTGGYRLLASDGGMFCFSAPYMGSGTAGPTFVSIAATSTGSGYLLAGEEPAGAAAP